MARLARLAVAGQLHLVRQQARPGVEPFADASDRADFLAALREACSVQQVALHAYALLDGELRLLATPATDTALSRVMQSVGRRFGAAFNRRHKRSGPLWSGRFKAVPVEASAFLAGLRFVESSPQAPLASSAPHHEGLRADPLVAAHAEFWKLGNTPFEREAAYRRLREQALTPGEIERIDRALRGGWPLGSAEFVVALQARTLRRMASLPRGRPKTVPY